MYTIYHIPGKKIGVTRNINNRVTEQQGYAPDEYEVLLTSDDIDYISDMEIELQKSYGYKVDRQKYNNLIKSNKMNINATEQTSTFPCPMNKLKGRLMDSIDTTWETDFGSFKITKKTIPWIIKNARVSMFNPERTYVYNKAFAKEFVESRTDKKQEPEVGIYDLIRIWADEKGIYNKGDSKTQYIKLMEEAGELAQAILKNDETEVIDAIGDMVVVLTNLAALRGHKIETCVASAYSVIKSRQGSMVNGTFVKDENSTTTTTYNKFHNFSTNTL